MLLVIRTQTTIIGAALLYLGSEFQRIDPRPVESSNALKKLRIIEDQGFEEAMIRAAFTLDDLIVPEKNLDVQQLATYRTETACHLPEALPRLDG